MGAGQFFNLGEGTTSGYARVLGSYDLGTKKLFCGKCMITFEIDSTINYFWIKSDSTSNSTCYRITINIIILLASSEMAFKAETYQYDQ